MAEMRDAPITIHGTGTVRDTYALEAGRCITKNGTPFFTLHGVGDYSPTELDAMAHVIVDKLNN